MTYSTTAAAMGSALAATTGYKVHQYPTTSPMVPCHVLCPQATNYDLTMRDGAHEEMWTVRTLVGAASEQYSLGTAIYGAMSPTGSASVKAALEADKTLGGRVQSLRVTSVSEPGFYDYGSGTLLGVEFTVNVVP